MTTDESRKAYSLQLIASYRRPLEPFFRYIPWFSERVNKKQGQFFDGEDISGTIPIAVYDSTLLNFVRGMQETGLMDRNYPYIFRKYYLNTVFDERALIERCGLTEVDVILGIMAKYVLGGMTRGVLWNEAVEEGIFYLGLTRIKTILEMYSDVTVHR